MIRKLHAVIIVVVCALLAAIFTPTVDAMLQRPTGTVVSGATSTGVPAALLINSSGALLVDNSPSGLYPTPFLSGILPLASGGTTTVVSVPIVVTSMLLSNTTNNSVTFNVMDASGNYIFPPNFVIPAGQAVALPVGTGLLYSGVNGSVNATGGKINVGGNQ